MPLAIEAEGLVKRFKDTTALRDVHLAVPAGTVHGVLGPNGAGKTTAVRILATLLTPDAGRARVGGHDLLKDPVTVRRSIGLTGQYAALDEELSALENLALIGRLMKLSSGRARARAKELLGNFGLTDAMERPVKTYSGGMRRRADLAASLVGRPSVLYLDEPTTGLDPHSRNEVWDTVRGLVAQGVTVLLTTQYLEEADQLADRITVFNHGTVVAEGRPDELKRRAGGQTLQVRPTRREHVDTVAQILLGLTGHIPARDEDSGRLTVPLLDPMVMSALVQHLAEAGVAFDELGLRLPTMDETFLAITSPGGRRAPLEETLGGRPA
ncbi:MULTISPECIES: daunorubicin resistance protein DrrA family ABC transporter ATP-binding protein [Streptomyces]|uniref:ABC-type xenobiotic transporter n=1 Tax=Streptomyces cacaoi TaxID=1898 RepID=A0A4Y3R2M2_STRCI|nr:MULTISPECIES: daunorubicin resistance protein DrrA family ABC transporter ATP-binding protein [Streptomyces]NNG85978.1 daunorubicin resistance protein DrrA family ABC transporter ATP-binding protein [Streptomyces cacaoi]QHF93436.1 daunorubicin resistance protein DrrA family ABC transporter ATP-binding protein [Streptomyces sp. NHF165]GEB51013.1 daunorubicin resistance protein DrrA family ABC transporter ATP-binding protein [Streptomyces cacaoi]